jgi:hypothetical protein
MSTGRHTGCSKLQSLLALKNKELTHTELMARLKKNLNGKFSGNISWYGETLNWT